MTDQELIDRLRGGDEDVLLDAAGRIEEMMEQTAALSSLEEKLDAYHALGTEEELAALVEARDEGRVHIGRCLDCKYYDWLAVCSLIGDCGGTNFYCGWFEQRAEAEAALWKEGGKT